MNYYVAGFYLGFADGTGCSKIEISNNIACHGRTVPTNRFCQEHAEVADDIRVSDGGSISGDFAYLFFYLSNPQSYSNPINGIFMFALLVHGFTGYLLVLALSAAD